MPPNCGTILDVVERRSMWFELFYDLVFVAALVNGCHLVEGSPTYVGQLLGPDVGLGAWLAATLAVMLVLWTLTTLYANLYRTDDWTARSLILIQMFSVAVSMLAIGPKEERLQDGVGFAALGVAFLSVSLLYGRADRSKYRQEALLVTWSTALAAIIFFAAVPFSESEPWKEEVMFAAGALVGCVPVCWTLLRRVVTNRLVDVAHFSQRIGELLLIVLGELFVEVLIRIDGVTRIPNPPVLAATFLLTFATGAIYFTAIEPWGLPRRAGALQFWFLAFYLLIFGLMAAATRFGVLVVQPLQQTFSISWFWTVVPLLYIVVALSALLQISRKHGTVPAAMQIRRDA